LSCGIRVPVVAITPNTMLLSFVLLSSALVFADAQTAGGIINSVDQTDINVALNHILDDVGILDFTRIAIGIANLGNKRLVNPKWYVHSGDTSHTMPVTVGTGQTGLNLFVRINFSVYGTEGVFTYDIEGTPICVAVMWTVPNVGANNMNVKVYPQLTPNRALYEQMRDVAGEWGTGMWGSRTEFGVSVRGSITTGWAVKQIVYVDTTGYNLSQGPSYNAWCKKNLIGSDYCVRECSPIGKCDTNVKCSDDRDCNGNQLTCSAACA